MTRVANTVLKAPRIAVSGSGWSATPRFDWQLLGGKIGQEARSGDWLALYNETARDCMIWFDRDAGVDIGWPSSETWSQQIEDAVLQAVRDHWQEAVAYLQTYLESA
jgi:hypothetical protein